MAFWKSLFTRSSSSKDVAKKRLQLLLIHDQVDLTPIQMVQMKQEIVEVIERYLSVESDETHVVLDRMDKQIRLVGSIPLRENSRRKRSSG
jgi:cell division topological specificity factor